MGDSSRVWAKVIYRISLTCTAMAPMKKSVKAMAQGAIADEIAKKCELKKSQAAGVLKALAAVGTKEVKSNGIFTVAGLCRIKTRMKPATKAGKREMFGKIHIVKAKPARKIVKAFPVAALKHSV